MLCLFLASLVALMGPLVDDERLGPARVEVEASLDTEDRRHVRALYLDALGRTPDEDELELALGGRAETLVRYLTGSEEFWEQWYEEELYYFLLLDNFRPAPPAPGQSVPERLAAGRLDVVQAVRGLVGGVAFNRANPGNDTFVSVVFEQLLGLVVQRETALLEAGKKMYDGHRASLWGSEGRSQADVVRIACEQDEFFERFVRRQHQRMVGVAPTRTEARRWGQQLRDDPDVFVELCRQWLLSPRYAERLDTLRPKSDRQFVRALHVDLFGEVPALETLQRYRTALAAVADGGPLRSVIAGVLLDGRGAGLPERGQIEAGELIDGVYARFLGRSPGAEEREAMILAYTQSEAQPDLVVRAVITHWEYQYY